MSAKSHPGQCREPRPPQPLRSRCPQSCAWAPGSRQGRERQRVLAQSRPRPAARGWEWTPVSASALGTSFSSCHGSPTLAFILAVGSNKLRCPGTLELIKPATETCRKLEPRLKKKKEERRKRKQPLSAGVRTGQLILWKTSEVGTPNLQSPSESGLRWQWTLKTTHTCRELPLK